MGTTFRCYQVGFSLGGAVTRGEIMTSLCSLVAFLFFFFPKHIMSSERYNKRDRHTSPFESRNEAVYNRQLDSLGDAQIPMEVRELLTRTIQDPEVLNRLTKQFDSLGGAEIPIKRRFDAIDHSSGFASLRKRNTDAFDHQDYQEDRPKRAFDRISHGSFASLRKRSKRHTADATGADQRK